MPIEGFNLGGLSTAAAPAIRGVPLLDRGARPAGNRSGRSSGRRSMPTVHPQLQKARDLMPLIAAASDEHDEIRKLTRPVVKSLVEGGFFTMLKTKSVGGM